MTVTPTKKFVGVFWLWKTSPYESAHENALNGTIVSSSRKNWEESSMNKIMAYQIPFRSKELKQQVEEFLNYYGKEKVNEHSYQVADEARKLAEKFNLSAEKAYVAGLLHDISVVIPNEERVALQRSLNKEVLKEEEILPMILHQKQSVFVAEELFGIQDAEILSAIECHTTLRKNASDLDKVVFIADKVKWDRDDSAPYLEELNQALTQSLDEGCRVYIRWALSDIIVLHPWLKDAMDDLALS